MYKSTFNLIIFFLLIKNIFSDDPVNITNIDCTLDEDCDTCIFCGNTTQDYSQCGYSNLFCHHIQNNNYDYNSNLKSKYSAHFRNDAQIQSFCGEKNILLDSTKDSFTLLKTRSNLLSKKIHCDYVIKNDYYLNHNDDQAKLHLEITKLNSGNTAISFDLYMIYKKGKSLMFSYFSDENIREYAMNKTLTQISEIEILIDFKNNELSIDECLEISIITENPSKKTKIIYIIALVICVFLALSIIILIILYICIKKKLENRFREHNEDDSFEKEKKMQENKKKIEQLYKTVLRPQKFTNELLSQNCENTICSICTDNYEIEKSQVMITPCKHIFHYDCLKPWIDNNILSPKCPNCNYNILDSLLITKSMDITKKKEDYNNDNNNRDNRDNIIVITNNDNNNFNMININSINNNYNNNRDNISSNNNNNISVSNNNHINNNNNMPDSNNTPINNNNVVQSSENIFIRNNENVDSKDQLNN